MTKGITQSAATVYGRAATLAALAGGRSMMPLALLATTAGRNGFLADAPRPWSLLRSRGAAIGFGLAAAGEVVADKSPIIPSRLKPGPLVGRLLLGALTGASVCRDAHRSPVVGAALGAAAAGGGAAAGYYARAALGRATGLPDPVWGVGEDAITLGLGLLALR